MRMLQIQHTVWINPDHIVSIYQDDDFDIWHLLTVTGVTYRIELTETPTEWPIKKIVATVAE